MTAGATGLPAAPFVADFLAGRLEAGAMLWRVHGVHDPATFPPVAVQGAHPGRFTPLNLSDLTGLYCGRSVDAALYEAIGRNAPLPPPGGGHVRIHLDELKGRYLSAMQTSRDVRFADLSGPGLTRVGIKPSNFTEHDPAIYATTVTWARAASRSGFEALVWNSVRNLNEEALIVYGPAQTQAPLKALDDPVPLWFGHGLDLVTVAFEAVNVHIVGAA
ncbi:RES family NAD+ phosphorylase [Aeromicrobium massiliense]|uniref:RES family NAD+ phosphorylase n=1 Tax=Aeromicrobium massiliense TaxID=1464554 RepID=UPI0011C81A9F|nr:RES family NAD+ phosphorylase [Aeromicrobium massiliense]